MRLADFAERLTDEEWSTPVTEGGKPGRSVGVIVHHVASLYPIEVELASTIATGKPIIGVTWEAVAQLNGMHSIENATVTKAEAL